MCFQEYRIIKVIQNLKIKYLLICIKMVEKVDKVKETDQKIKFNLRR